MGKSLNYPVEGKSIYFWTEKQLGEFLRQAGQDAEKRERAERESREIVFVKPEKPERTERTPRKPKKEKKVKEPKPPKEPKPKKEKKQGPTAWEIHDTKYVGHTFGGLHVLRYDHSEGGRRWYVCHCDICGRNTLHNSKHFNGGRVMSCGCLARENYRLRRKKSSHRNVKVLESSE